jgi:hypothetical protein
MAPRPAATAPPRNSATRSLDSIVSGSGTQWKRSLNVTNTTPTSRNAAAVASPTRALGSASC